MAFTGGSLVTFAEVFEAADYDWQSEASVDYGDGVDRRRVKVGGLGFDDVNDSFRLPSNTTSVDITLDGEVVGSVEVEPLESDDV